LALLGANAEKQDFFNSADWFHNFYAHALEQGQKPRIYTLESHGKTCAVLPMLASQRGRWLCSAHLSAASNYFSPLYRASIAVDQEANMALPQLVQSMCSESPRWDSIDVHPLDPATPAFTQLQQAFRQNGLLTQTYFCFGNWFLRVGGRSYDEYAASLPSTLKNTLARKTRKLEKHHQWHFTLYQNDADLALAITDYQKIYAASWKPGEEHPAFIPTMIRNAARAGSLRLGIIYIDGQAGAAQLWITEHHTASIFKLAYDPRFADLSIGTILTAAMMRQAIDIDHVEEIDYLSGDDLYKRDWMSHRRERWGILALNPRTVGGMMSIFRHLGGRWFKLQCQRVRQLFQNKK
jgi:CelD/BcsL family acetyltransferase involved in cellulose biosynthesis